MTRRCFSLAHLIAMALAVTAALLGALRPSSTAAHPADRLLQHLIVTVDGNGVSATIAISGGLLATEYVAHQIDQNRDGVFAPEEAQRWLAGFLGNVRVLRDGQPVTLDPSRVTLALPDPNRFQLGLAPLTVSFQVPPASIAGPSEAMVVVANDYLVDMTDFRLDASQGAGGTLLSPPAPGRTVRLSVRIDPSQAGAAAKPADVAATWSASGVVAEANDLLRREKTPGFILAMLAVFAVMGALHALQPGHGKTLVAAYLVATGGTSRDAMTLAGIVTFTHTASVFLLGGATLAASEWFLPSRVIPILSLFSGLLVAGMGASMLWRSTRRWRGAPVHTHSHDHDHDHEHDHAHHHHAPDGHHRGHDHDHGHDHGHDHATMTDEEHARAHLAELGSVFVEREGRRRVSFRQLLTLGVSGGIAPCPDALAILLLAVGLGQAAFGMVAIVAFSAGLSLVLVAFGIAVALVRPAWSRARASAGPGGGWMDRLTAPLGRVAAMSPVISALVVFALGVGMLWKAAAL